MFGLRKFEMMTMSCISMISHVPFVTSAYYTFDTASYCCCTEENNSGARGIKIMRWLMRWRKTSRIIHEKREAEKVPQGDVL